MLAIGRMRIAAMAAGTAGAKGEGHAIARLESADRTADLLYDPRTLMA